MLVFKAAQVVSSHKNEPKPWKMEGREGVNHTANLACFGERGDVASIKLKAKSAEELDAKLKRYPIGKPAEVQILEIVPIFKAGDRKAAAYEYTA